MMAPPQKQGCQDVAPPTPGPSVQRPPTGEEVGGTGRCEGWEQLLQAEGAAQPGPRDGAAQEEEGAGADAAAQGC